MSNLRVGTIGYTVQSGLGNLVKDFYDNGVIQSILKIRHPRYDDCIFYPENVIYRNADEFLKNTDVLLIIENAFNYWSVVKTAKQLNKKIVLIPMYEYTPFPIPIYPNKILCPSPLDYKIYIEKLGYPENITHLIQIPITSEIRWRYRTEANLFIHNAGHGGVDYRNGTPELIEAMKLIKSNAKLLIRFQPDSKQMDRLYKSYKHSKNIEWVGENLPFNQLFDIGDVFVFPEKFNGLSLPLQEAYASGMLVMATNRFPNNWYLPNEPLIPVFRETTKRIAIPIKESIVDPLSIAKKIDEFHGQNISVYSINGRHWGYKNSWDCLRNYIKDMIIN